MLEIHSEQYIYIYRTPIKINLILEKLGFIILLEVGFFSTSEVNEK